MLSTEDLFYGQIEPIWIMKAEKKDDKKEDGNPPNSKRERGNASYPVVSLIAPVPMLNPYQLPYSMELIIPTPATKDDAKGKGKADSQSKEKKKETEVVMKVPICCSECEELVKVSLYCLKGVKSVDCLSYKKKVTVVATTAAAADILLECRKLFKQSRMWTEDDYP